MNGNVVYGGSYIRMSRFDAVDCRDIRRIKIAVRRKEVPVKAEVVKTTQNGLGAIAVAKPFEFGPVL